MCVFYIICCFSSISNQNQYINLLWFYKIIESCNFFFTVSKEIFIEYHPNKRELKSLIIVQTTKQFPSMSIINYSIFFLNCVPYWIYGVYSMKELLRKMEGVLLSGTNLHILLVIFFCFILSYNIQKFFYVALNQDLFFWDLCLLQGK